MCEWKGQTFCAGANSFGCSFGRGGKRAGETQQVSPAAFLLSLHAGWKEEEEVSLPASPSTYRLTKGRSSFRCKCAVWK